jgi:predicted secreted protein
MRIKTSVIGVLLMLCALPLFGGDSASFLNLGFSDNNRYFMFAQYGVREKTSFPYADLFVVDVPTNRFVTGGVKHAEYQNPAEPGYSGEGALFQLYRENLPLVQRHGIRHLETGRILYLLIDGEKPKELLEFRDFITGVQYRVRLIQHAFGSGRNVRSSFHIDLTVTAKSGAVRSFVVGLPNYERKGVRGYRIRQIILSPDAGSLIFVIEKEEIDQTGSDIRYMVETVRVF